MPAPQLHLTFGETLGRERELCDDLRAACASEPRYTRLGAIFHDLAYYGNMALMAVRYGLGPGGLVLGPLVFRLAKEAAQLWRESAA